MVLPAIVVGWIALLLIKTIGAVLKGSANGVEAWATGAETKRKEDERRQEERSLQERERMRDEDPDRRSTHYALVLSHFQPLHGLEWGLYRRAGIDFVVGKKENRVVVSKDVANIQEARLFRETYRPSEAEKAPTPA